MLSEYKRKLSPVQMEQMIIHLKSEMEKYKYKSEKYEREIQKHNTKHGKEKNYLLSKKIDELQNELSEQKGESMMLKDLNDKLQNELLSFKASLEELKGMIELEVQKGDDREERNIEMEREIDALSEIMSAFTTNQTHLQGEYEKLEKEIGELHAEKEAIKKLNEKLLDYKKLIETQEENIKSYQEKKSEEVNQLKRQMTEKEKDYQLAINELNEALNRQKQEQEKLNDELDSLKEQLKKEEENNKELHEILTKVNEKKQDNVEAQTEFHFTHDEVRGKFSHPNSMTKTNEKPSYTKILPMKTGQSKEESERTSLSSKNTFKYVRKATPSREKASPGLNSFLSTSSTVNPFKNIGK